MLPNLINDNQLKLVSKYCSDVVKNNDEVHAGDMPFVVNLVINLAKKGYWIEQSQMDQVCDNLHSLGDRDKLTSESLRNYLRSLSIVGYHYALNQHGTLPEHFVRTTSQIADDIIAEKEIDYSEA